MSPEQAGQELPVIILILQVTEFHTLLIHEFSALVVRTSGRGEQSKDVHHSDLICRAVHGARPWRGQSCSLAVPFTSQTRPLEPGQWFAAGHRAAALEPRPRAHLHLCDCLLSRALGHVPGTHTGVEGRVSVLKQLTIHSTQDHSTSSQPYVTGSVFYLNP